MTVSAGIDVGTSSVKAVVVRAASGDEPPVVLSTVLERLRRRDPKQVIAHTWEQALASAGVGPGDVAYVASTGEGHLVDFRTGHFFGMTTHARGGSFLRPEATGVLDIGALHARAIKIDERARVLGYRMTSQCASGSGQFLENIARYLGVTIEEVGDLSCAATSPEKPSGICAVLAETDVINMVSRGIARPDILKGIHLSMADRLAKLLRSAGISGTVMLTGGLAADVGLRAALAEQIADEQRAGKKKLDVRLAVHDQSVYAGALGAALWASVRHQKILRRAVA